MTTLDKYGWWGSGGKEPPPHLKTKKQLAELGLRPLQPIGVIETQKFNCLLFDPNDPNSAVPKRQPSQKQLEILARNREKAAYERWLRRSGWIEKDRTEAVRWAYSMLQRDDWVLLDTETTGLGDAEIVEIAIVDSQGSSVLDTLIKPTISIPKDATLIHGITNEMVADSPNFPSVYPRIVAALENKDVVIYNADFDIHILKYCCNLHKLPLLEINKRSHCLMLWYSQWVGNYSKYWNSYRWQPLQGGHRAWGDCLKALEYLKEMALDSPEMRYPPGVVQPSNR